jgi:signal transduction histidine kinase
MKPTGAFLFALSAGLMLAGLASGAPLQLDEATGLLAAGALLAELYAVPLPGEGFYSAGGMFYLAAALLPESGARRAALLMLAALTLRSTMRGTPQLATRIRDWTCDALPAVISVAAACGLRSAGAPFMLSAGAGALLLWLLGVVTPGVLYEPANQHEDARWRRVRRRLMPFGAAGAALGVSAALLMRASPWWLLWLLPLVAAMRSSALSSLEEEDARDRLALELQMKQTHRQLQETLQTQAVTRVDLQRKIEENILLEEVGRALAHIPDVADMARAIVKRARTLVRCQTVVLYLLEDERLTARESSGSIAEPLAPIDVKARASTLPAAAWASRQPVQASTDLYLFAAERKALALPLETVGVLYVGMAGDGAFEHDELHRLSLLANQAALALQSARRYQSLREAHEDLVKAHEELARSEAQLIQSSKLAAVGQLAAGVAHEMNSPLGALQLGIDAALARLESNPQATQKKLETCQRAVERARDIVRKLLFYARETQSGRQPISISHVVTDTLELLGHQLSLDSVEVTTDLAETPPIEANANELQQVFTNLILNARDAVLLPQAKARRVRISCSVQEGEVKVEIADEGPGIPADVQQRIFEPFFTTKEVGKGTGLGLAVSHQIVTGHGGTISVSSAAGGPTTFAVKLPVKG